ncbi:MAG TPA: LuxR C-terminal-related transcriptional regulator [Acidimicrobiales bacterium]|nr:LuxR C-terminal-related transcriptional regulator [Acidimicrobiales bacterium]
MNADERASLLPVGTVTFLVSDASRSEVAAEAVAAHNGLHADAKGAAVGDGTVVAVFGDAADGLAAAIDMQRRLLAEPAPDPGGPAPRTALHTGEALLRDERYYTGAALTRCARLRDIAHQGQTLLSSATAELVADAPPEGVELRDLGIHRLRDLSHADRVCELRTTGFDREFPPLRSLDAITHNLPIQLTSFVGRADELAAVERLIRSERLVTLTGAGGAGKTRLAAQAAAELAEHWPDGVWWVDLGPVTDPTLVAELTASTIGVMVEPVGGPRRALSLQLRDRRVLLCLDNCEHLIESSAELVETVLRTCTEVSVLATSREPLGVAGETVWRVPSLQEEEAVALFVDRASRVRPWFTLDATNEAAVRTLCRRLDGIPLAVELAAAWLRTLTPAQIAAGLDDRFALLVRGPRSAARRQQTLAASMDWSHDLLDECDRAVFRRLGAFKGGFSLDAARAVCADAQRGAGQGGTVDESDVLTALGRLVDKSLVVVDERRGEARYRLLETIRQYAVDRLAAAREGDAAAERHLDHFLALVEATEPELEGPDQDASLDRLETEHDNLRAALDWGLGLPDPNRARRLAGSLVWLWYKHGHGDEGLDVLQRAIDRAPDDRSPVQAQLLVSAAAMAQVCGQFRLIVDYAQRGVEVATLNHDDRVRGRCLFLLAVVQFYLDLDAAWELCGQALACAAAAGDAFTADAALVVQGSIPCTRDRFDTALPLLQEGGERCLRRGDRTFAALALNYQDDIATSTGDIALAERLATRALEVAGPLGDYYAVGLSKCHVAFVTGLAGDLDGALRILEPVVRSVEGADHAVFIPRMGSVLGMLHMWSGDPAGAIAWFERDVRTADPVPPDNLIVARSLPGLVAALRHVGRRDEARTLVDRALVLARKLDVPHLVADALEQSGLLTAADDPGAAEELHHEALALRVEHGLRTFVVDSLDALAGLASRAESSTEAVRLLAASDAARAAMGYPRPPIDRPGHEATVARLRAALGDQAFSDAWAEGATLSLDDVVAYARRARGARTRPSTGWASLTPTELDVVRLVAEGLTNPEIGARLFISRATVKTHLSHVYAKLHLSNRTELAALAGVQSGRGDQSPVTGSS